MAERGAWALRLWFLLVAGLLVAAPLLPLHTEPRPFAAPDLLLAATLAWAARRPDALPVLVVGGVFLLADLLFQRPPGLFTALVVLATEWLRARAARLGKAPFLVEWATVAACVVGVALADRAVLALLATPQPRWGLTLIQVVLTVAAYPLVVALARLALGLRRAGAEGEAMGGRP